MGQNDVGFGRKIVLLHGPTTAGTVIWSKFHVPSTWPSRWDDNGRGLEKRVLEILISGKNTFSSCKISTYVMWKLDLEDYFYKIYDSNKQIAGYFDPDYGVIQSSGDEFEQIQKMHKDADKIARGFLILPMVKFGIFGEQSMQMLELQGRVEQAGLRIEHWKGYLQEFPHSHSITVSHTDPDMLSITLEIRFSEHVPLDKKALGKKLEPVLDRLQDLGLL